MLSKVLYWHYGIVSTCLKCFSETNSICNKRWKSVFFFWYGIVLGVMCAL